MRTISTEKIQELRRSGNSVKLQKGVAPQKVQKGPTVEQSLQNLTLYAKQVAMKKDYSKVIIDTAEEISDTLSLVTKKIVSLQAPEMVKEWSVEVTRDHNNYIKSLRLTAKI